MSTTALGGAVAPRSERAVVRPNLRSLAVAACGGSAFLDMYATQPLLPALRAAFHAGEAAVGATISTLTLATALAAPFVGPLADAVGRKRIIVSAILGLGLVTFATATAHTLHELLLWRFVQGLFMPAIFAVTVAYIAEEFPPATLGRTFAAYMTGNVFGGFAGRFVAALVAGHSDWHAAFVVLGALNLAGGAFVWYALPRSTKFRRASSARDALSAVGRFARSPRMWTVFGVGGSVLFTNVAGFTFVAYRLAEPPFALGTVALGNVFFVYLAGLIGTPLAGRLIDRAGHRTAALVAFATSGAGMLLTLSASLVGVLAGLALLAAGVFAAQTASQAYIGVVAPERRSTAASLYLTVYYVGGALGAIAPAGVWDAFGWPGIVVLIVAVQIAAASIVALAWLPAAVSRQAGAPVEP